ncbi:MAG: hypothetical protein ACOYNL_02660 [Rickettsiales bacterium]
MKRNRTMIAPAALALTILMSTAAMAYDNDRYNHNRGMKYRGCARMIDNSASSNTAHKGGVNTGTGWNDVTFDNCSPLSDGHAYNERRSDRDWNRDRQARHYDGKTKARRGNMATKDSYDYERNDDMDRGNNYRGY